MMTKKSSVTEARLDMKTISAEIVDFNTAKDAIKARVGDYPESYNFGNKLLYDLCREHPLSKMTIRSSEQDDKLTKDEAAFADEMWLIGRAYAASPQRYVYKNGMTKPTEDYLLNEGYESFFADIARILFRGPYNRDNSPRGYLRGKECILSARSDISNDLDLSKAEAVKRACDTLDEETPSFLECFTNLSDEQYEFDYPRIEAKDTIIVISEHDFRLLCQTVSCVIQFSKLIGSARLLRDAAILKQSCTKDADDIRTTQQKKWSESKRKNKSKTSPQDVWKEAQNEWKKTMKEGEQSLCLSFSSKFLHFHCPQLFFIYDSISSNNLGNLGKQTTLSLMPEINGLMNNADITINFTDSDSGKALYSKYLEIYNGLDSKDVDDEKEEENKTKGGSKGADYNQEAPYVVHACKELTIAYLIHNAINYDSQRITRLADFLITNAIKPGKQID